MVAKNRSPLQVDPKFLRKLKNLRVKVLATEQETSLRQLTEEMARDDIFGDFEKKILCDDTIKIKLDRRYK